ncbi:hypothetical protein GGF38_000174 [Coemansia sp. RSA 25]|nr:hypothetical protein GGF38_000174 [Coemansia sp. RSA 25]
MMQEETIRSLSSLSLSGGGGAGNRSSVVDRVKWIEQTHGGGPSTQGVPGAQPRARLRLPKHFISAQAEAAAATPDASLSPKTPPAGLLSPRDGSNSGGGGGGAGWGAARLPPAMTQQLSSSSKIPTLARRAEQMPSPAISEASTVAGADEVFGDAPAAAKADKAASAASAASAAVPAVVEVVVEALPDVAPPVEAVAPSPALVEAPHATIGAVDIEPQEPEPVDLAPTAVSVEPVSAVELVEPVSEANSVEPVPVADLIELEAAEPPLLSPMERPVSQAESTHARMPSEAPSTASNCSSNLTDPDDPVHVTSTMRGAGQYNNNNNVRTGANDTPRAVAAEPTTTAAASHYATLPRSTKFTGSKVQGLGGTRNRPQQAPRRYDRSQPTHQRPESSASMQSRNSEDSCRSGSVFSRPKVEAPRLQAKEQSLSRSFSTKPAMFSKSTPPPAAANDGDQAEYSLLARLNDLSATRPNAQDMVSNRSSPKFVKRSQYYGPSSQDDVVSSGSNGSGPRNRAQRRFR